MEFWSNPHPVVGRQENILPAAPVKFLKFFQGKVKEPVPEAERLAAYRRHGDVALLGALYEPYMELVFGVCFQYLRDEDESKDAVMQIFEKIIIDLKQHEVSNFKSWLHSVARNHCLMKLRATRVTVEAASVDEREQELQTDTEPEPDVFALDGRLDDRKPAGPPLNGKFHNQDGIFGQKTYEHDQPDLHVDIVIQPDELGCRERSYNTRRDREQDGQWEQVALVLRGEQEVHKQHTKREDKHCLVTRRLLFQAKPGPFVTVVGRQFVQDILFKVVHNIPAA